MVCNIHMNRFPSYYGDGSIHPFVTIKDLPFG